MNSEIMKALGFGKEVERIETGQCPMCDKKIVATEFRNQLSRQEYLISGMCQVCQDSFFGAD